MRSISLRVKSILGGIQGAEETRSHHLLRKRPVKAALTAEVAMLAAHMVGLRELLVIEVVPDVAREIGALGLSGEKVFEAFGREFEIAISVAIVKLEVQHALEWVIGGCFQGA
jgi:hypothetical protein